MGLWNDQQASMGLYYIRGELYGWFDYYFNLTSLVYNGLPLWGDGLKENCWEC